MNDLRFYVRAFQSISVILGRWLGEDCVQQNLVYGWKDVRPKRVSNQGPLYKKASTESSELPGFLTALVK